MARGWESKGVEEQVNSRSPGPVRHSGRPPINPEQQAIESERRSIELSRTRVLQDLEAATNPRYRELLQRSLAFLDEKLAQLSTREAGVKAKAADA